MVLSCDLVVGNVGATGRASEVDEVVVKWFGAGVVDAEVDGGEQILEVSDNDVAVRAASDEAEVKGSRRLIITAAVGSEDRKGDLIDPQGWELEGYRRNPVFLWAHDRSMPPIGRASRVWVEGEELKALVEFAPTAFATEIADLYARGFMRGVSVGFIPLAMEMREASNGRHGYWYKRHELLEISAVPVPMHSSALASGGQDREVRDVGEFLEMREGMRRLWRAVSGMGEL
ncbi:MAG: HK97 family phage prohead protease [Chloroflexi bacterium]|nr:HK97 family phage prohead protease [Chloroflexota bacterium]